jgi:glycosyltransferase involved in cell wall biosynthesis
MTRPTFSVIVPTYSRPAMLAQAVESVLAQTRSDFECLVVDDASPTPPALPADPRVRLIQRTSNGGPAAARNTGIEQASGQYLAFLDDDDLFLPARLELALEGLQQAPIALCWGRFLDNSTRRNRLLRGNVHDVIVDDGVPSLNGTAIGVDRSISFDPRFAALQDADWWLRISRDTEVWTTDQFGYVVRKHAGIRNLNDAQARLRATLLLLDKHADYFNRHPRAAAVRWRRAGVMARRLGDHALARRALARSVLLRPQLKTFSYLIRSVRPSTSRVKLVSYPA